jgi:arginase
MTMIAVPYFMGNPMAGLRVPDPHETLAPVLPDGGALQRMGVLYSHLAERAAKVDQPMSYAGDCVSAIGMLAGLQRRDVHPTLIWFDAHGDFNTPETSPSGFPGGMPLAMLTGRGDQTVVHASGLTPLPDERVILVDGRDLDPGEEQALAASAITHATVADFFDSIPLEGPLHVHLDGDVVDPTEMPAMNYPAFDGPSLDSVRRALADLAETGRVVALSVSSWNPALPGADTAASAMLTLVDPFVG